MNAIALLKYQLAGITSILHEVAGDLTTEEWLSRPAPGQNLTGFTLWHIPTTQDWTIQTWIRNVSEVRERPDWAGRGGLNVSRLAFGLTLAEADAVAHATNPADLLAYADAVLAENLPWLETLTEAALDQAPDNRAHLGRHPAYQSPGYRAEVDDMWDQPVWRLLAGACIGHCREHLGEVMGFKEILRRSNR